MLPADTVETGSWLAAVGGDGGASGFTVWPIVCSHHRGEVGTTGTDMAQAQLARTFEDAGVRGQCTRLAQPVVKQGPGQGARHGAKGLYQLKQVIQGLTAGQ
jgi:hypothetical protein